MPEEQRHTDVADNSSDGSSAYARDQQPADLSDLATTHSSVSGEPAGSEPNQTVETTQPAEGENILPPGDRESNQQREQHIDEWVGGNDAMGAWRYTMNCVAAFYLPIIIKTAFLLINLRKMWRDLRLLYLLTIINNVGLHVNKVFANNYAILDTTAAYIYMFENLIYKGLQKQRICSFDVFIYSLYITMYSMEDSIDIDVGKYSPLHLECKFTVTTHFICWNTTVTAIYVFKGIRSTYQCPMSDNLTYYGLRVEHWLTQKSFYFFYIHCLVLVCKFYTNDFLSYVIDSNEFNKVILMKIVIIFILTICAACYGGIKTFQTCQNEDRRRDWKEYVGVSNTTADGFDVFGSLVFSCTYLFFIPQFF